MLLQRILSAADGAHYVHWDEENCRLYLWYGGVTVNILGTLSGEAIDCFSLEYRAEPYEWREVLSHIQEHIKETAVS